MLERLQHKFALSPQGAKDLVKGSLFCTLQSISFMFPVGLLYYFVSDLIHHTLEGKELFYIIGVITLLLLIFIITHFEYNSTFLATYVETGTRRITLAEKLRKIPLSYFSKKDLADLTNTIMADCTYLETAFSHWIPPFVGALVSTIIISISLLFFNLKMSLAALWVLPISFLIVVFSSKIQRTLTQKSIKAQIACEDGIQECIETIQDLKANNAQDQYLKGLDKKIDAVEKRARISEFTTALFVGSAQLILKLGIVTVALVGSNMLIHHEIDVLTFFMYLLVVSRLYDPMQQTLQNLAAIIATGSHVTRMNEILDHEVQSGAKELINNNYDIEFEHVDFSYNPQEQVLKDVSFIAKQGEVTAVVGPSGSGKTTISRLAARFWDISSGTIKVGGMDISKIEPETLLSLYSIVFQDVTLFNNTVLENVRIGKKDATDQEVLEACKMAHCDEFVSKLANGYSTVIGENGCQLSGGERQRISIARAFLKDAPIILLDEATASLDVENETAIQEALSHLIKHKTVLIIAHRMRTVLSADKIVVLKEGSIDQIGTPDELLHTEGVFKDMVTLQNKSQNWKI